MEEKRWERNETFLDFLERNSLPLKIYYDLDKGDKELATEIISGINYQMLKSDNGEIEQILIPIADEVQLHIKKSNDGYTFETIPIEYEKKHSSVTIDIRRSPYQDIIEVTGNHLLAKEFVNSFKNSINFRRDLRRDDKIVIFYSQKIRLGKQFGSPVIEAAMVETRGRKNYIFQYKNGRYYDVKGKEVEGFFMSRPCRFTRISSKFTYKRWHPLLKRYRPHLGIDYAAPVGTPVKSTADGKVIFVGRKGGYGRTVMVRHANGYKTLYAHLHRYRKGIRSRWVKKGQTIGYVGSSGMSTGPHLHFGLYKNGRAINPARVIKVTKSVLRGKKKKEFIRFSKDYIEKIEIALNDNKTPKKEEKFKNSYLLAVNLDKDSIDKEQL